MRRATGQNAILLTFMSAATLIAPMHGSGVSAADTIDNAHLKDKSRGWYILSQADGDDLLHGLPQRLGLAAGADGSSVSTVNGTDVAGIVTVEYDGELEGDVYVGVFADARFFMAAPAAVYRLSGPGRHEVRLPTGEWSFGAMLGLPPKPKALGVDQSWPQPIHVVAGESPEIRVLVSQRFRSHPAGVPSVEEGFASLWKPVDPVRLAIVRTFSSNGEPSPFNRVTFVDRDDQETRLFHDVGTDHFGYAYCDKIDKTFSVVLQRFDIAPRQFLTRWHSKKFSRLHDANERPVIDFRWDDFPQGTGRIVGQVHDQHGQPLTEYFVTLTHQIGERMDWSDAETFAFKKAVLNAEGLFDIRGLPPGEYTALIRHFDYETHAWTFDGPKVVVPEAGDVLVEAEWEIEAKDTYYGRVQYEDGRPLTRGYWVANDFSNSVHEDGTFRVCLSQVEQDNLKTFAGNKIAIHGTKGARLLQIPLSALSRDPAKPAVFIVK